MRMLLKKLFFVKLNNTESNVFLCMDSLYGYFMLFLTFVCLSPHPMPIYTRHIQQQQ